jgi:aspartate ammonia-lyase
VAAAADAGQLELNVMMPVIAWNALQAVTIMSAALDVFRTRCVEGIEADAARCRELLDRSTAAATALSPYLGYAATAAIAKDAIATGRTLREIVLERGLMPAAELDRVLAIDAMTRPGIVGEP